MNTRQILSLVYGFIVRGLPLVVIVGVASASSGTPQENDEWNLFRRDAALTGVLPDGAPVSYTHLTLPTTPYV